MLHKWPCLLRRNILDKFLDLLQLVFREVAVVVRTGRKFTKFSDQIQFQEIEDAHSSRIEIRSVVLIVNFLFLTEKTKTTTTIESKEAAAKTKRKIGNNMRYIHVNVRRQYEKKE